MPEENQLAGNLLQTREEADRKASQKGQAPQATAPIYNPLLGISSREFTQIMAGNDPEHPMMTTDAYGTPKFHLENFGQTAPTTVRINAYGQHQVEGVEESMRLNMEQLQKDLEGFHESFAPEISRDKRTSSYFNQTLQATPQVIGQAGKSAGSMIMHAAHGILAQKRNFDELQWTITKDNNQDDPAFLEAGSVVKQLEDQGRNIRNVKIDNLDVSEKAKDYLRQYKQLEESRMADERRMRIAMAYDQDKTNIEEAMQNSKYLTWVKPLGGDENSVIHTMANLTGDVAGSVAVFWLGGSALGAAGKALGVASKVGRAAKMAEAATLAANGGADAAMIAAANIGERFVFWPSFFNQYDQIRTEALMAGKTVGEANAIGFVAGLAEGGLEYGGFKFFKRFYSDGGWIRNYVLRQIVPESLQEGSQTFAENVITQTFGVTDKQWSDVMAEIGMSIVAGALGGGLFSATHATAIGASAWAEGIQEDLAAKFQGLTSQQVNKATDAVNKAIDVVEAKAEADEKTDYMKAFAAANADEKLGPEDELKKTLKDFNELSKEEKTAAEAYVKAYEKLRDHYVDRMREKNPDISLNQLKNGWKAVRLQLVAQRDTGALAITFNDAINQAAAYLQPDSEVVKHNTEQLEKRLQGAGYTPEQIKSLTSADALEQHEAKWQMADEVIINRAKSMGVKESEAKLMAQFVRSLAYDATLINPGMSPADIMNKMCENMVNIQVGTLHDQNLPAMFTSVLNSVKANRFSRLSNKQKFEKATKIADALTADSVDPVLAAQISNDLYGDGNFDPDLSRTKAAVDQQAELFSIVLDHMPLQMTQNLGKIDYRTMVLLNRMGLSKDTILKELYEIKPNTKKELDGVFEEVAEKYLPRLTDTQLNNLEMIADGAENFNAGEAGSEIVDAMNIIGKEVGGTKESQKPAYTEEQAKKMQEGTGFYEADTNMMVLVNPKVGTALHEFGHFSLSYMVTSSLAMEKMGLLNNASPVHRAAEYLRNEAKRSGLSLTEEQLQETVLDALNDVIVKGQTDDPELTGLLNEMRASGIERYHRLSGSLYSRAGGKGSLKQAGKEFVSQQASSLLSGVTPGSMLADAYALREESRLENLPFEFNKAEQAPLKEWAERIKEFAKKYPISADVEIVGLDVAVAKGDAIKIAQCANSIATKLIDFATNELVTMNVLNYDSSEIPSGDTGIFFEGDTAVAAKRLPAAHFRDDISVWEKLKDVKWSESIGLAVQGVKDLLQSAEGAAGDIDEALGAGKKKRGGLRTLMMREFYDYGMNMQKFRETAKPLVDAVDKYRKRLKATPNAASEDAREWQKRFHLVLRNGQVGAYDMAGDFLEEKLGIEARNSWDATVELLKQTKTQLIRAGVDSDLLSWNGDFFPFAVKDYDAFVRDFLGHSHVFSNNEKERNRFIKEYQEKHPEETKENIERLYVALIDNQNSLMQRNADTETKVTSFYRRTIDYVSDPAIMEYYRDPFDCLDKYMESAYRTIMMRNLIGKTVYDAGGAPILFAEGQTGKVGQYVLDIPQGAVPKELLDNFFSKMRALALRDSGPNNTILDIVRQVNQITTLGNVFSAMNQVLDLEFCATLFGTEATAKAIKQVMSESGKSIKLEDVGALSSNEVFRMQDESALKDIGKKVFKLSGFEWTDRKIKEVALNAAANWAEKSLKPIVNAKDTNKKLSKSEAQDYAEVKYYIDECFPEFDERMLPQTMSVEEAKAETEKRNARRKRLMRVLANGGKDENGKWDADAKYVYWYLLTKLQPINAATVPANYNRMGAPGKMMYQFTTVATRQLGFLVDYWRMKERTGGSKIAAAKGMLRFLGFCAAIGIPNDLLQDIMKGRTPDAGKAMVMSPLHVMMINEYTIYTFKREGLWSAAITQFTPKAGFIDNISKDVIRMFEGKDFNFNTAKNIPILGVFMYQFMFGGLEQKKKMKTDIFGRTQDPEKARDAREKSRQKAESIKFLEEF